MSAMGKAGAALLCAILLCAALAHPICRALGISPDPGPDVDASLSRHHPLGTDDLGRDLLARMMHGGQRTLPAGLAAVSLAALLGILLGGTCALRGGRLDAMACLGIDLWMAFPALLMALFLAACLSGPADGTGRRIAILVLAVGLVDLPRFFRQARAAVAAELPREYVAASRALGCGGVRLLFARILPNCAGPLVALATLGLGTSILEIAGLGFLGLGVPPGTPEWGSDLNDYRQSFLTRPWVLAAAGTPIALSVLAFNLLGDSIREGRGHPR